MSGSFPLDVNMLREVLDYLNLGVYVTDTDRRILLWNRKATEITGYAAEDVVGSHCRDNILSHIDKDGNPLCTTRLCPLHRAIVVGKESGDPILVYAKKADGKRVPVLVSTAPLRDKEGKVIGGIEAFRDASHEITDLELARQVQRHLLPQTLPATDSIRFDVRYFPHSQVGGDFYDVRPLGDGRYGVLVADVQGHGVSAALYTMVLKSLEESQTELAQDAGGFAAALNRELSRFLIPGGFASAFYGVIDTDRRIMTCANAGHPPPLHFVARTGQVNALSAEGMLLGIVPDLSYESTTVELEAGDIVLCYTDGVTDAANAQGRTLDEKGLAALLGNEAPKKRTEMLDRLYRQVREYSNDVTLADDVLLLAIEIASPSHTSG